MHILTSKVISGRAASALYQDLEGNNIVFDSCIVPRRSSTDGRTILKNIVLNDSAHINCDIHTAALEEICINGLKRQGTAPLFLWGCVFRHVKIKGRVAGLKVNTSVSPVPGISDEERSAWDRLAADFYGTVDWALDISDAQFQGGVSFEAIPGDKVRINGTTQALVTRDALQASDWWRTYDFGVTPLTVELSWFLNRSIYESVVVAARSDSRYFKQDVASINALRAAGVAR